MANPHLAETQPPQPPAATAKRKTPADFQAEAERFNNSVQSMQDRRAEIEKQAGELGKERDTLIASAKDYGLTGSYARAILRKA